MISVIVLAFVTGVLIAVVGSMLPARRVVRADLLRSLADKVTEFVGLR